jgi:CMP-N-acetylneuraminic acid synthetase
MYKGKKFLAIIPARSGSQGLKNKNIKPLCGKPLLAYSIDQAKKANIFDYIFVSTDSQEYAQISQKYGAMVPFLRPKQISQSNSLPDQYILHAIENLKQLGNSFDYFALLQPTSPLRTSNNITKAAQILLEQNLDSVVSVCEAEHPIEYYNKLPKDLNLHNFSNSGFNRQSSQKYYRINGAIYLSKCQSYLKTRDFYGKNSKAYIMNRFESIDIDDRMDFELAEFILKLNKNIL